MIDYSDQRDSSGSAVPRAMEIIALTVISGFFHNTRNAILSLPIKIPGALHN